MKFESSLYIYALCIIPVLGGILFFFWQRNERSLSRIMHEDALKKFNTSKSIHSKIADMCVLVSILFCILAIARPQWGFSWMDVKQYGTDILVIMDVSKSMWAQDSKPSRLIAAKRKIIDFIKLLHGDRIGLIAFAGRAFVLTPLTVDYGALHLFLDQLDSNLVPVPGSAIAESLELAIKSLTKSKSSSKNIILLSDGEDLAGGIDDQLAQAKAHDVTINVIAFGSTDGAPIPDLNGGFIKDDYGNVVITKRQDNVLAKIADKTNGLFQIASLSDSDISRIYDRMLGTVSMDELKSGKQKRYNEQYQWVLLLALILLFIEMGVRSKRKRINFKKVFKRYRRILFIIIMPILFTSTIASATIFQVKQAEKLYNQKKYNLALELFLSEYSTNRNNHKLIYNIGNCYYQLGQFNEASQYYSKLCEMQSHLCQESLYNDGNAHAKQGDYENAIDRYERTLALNSTDNDAQHNLGVVKQLLAQKKEQQDEQNSDSDDDSQQSKSNSNDSTNNAQKKQNDDSEEQSKSDESNANQNQDDQASSDDNNQSEPDENNASSQQESTGNENKDVQENQTSPSSDDMNTDETQSLSDEKDDQGQDNQNQQASQVISISDDEAEKWLSRIEEGKRQFFPKGLQSQGKHKSKGTW